MAGADIIAVVIIAVILVAVGVYLLHWLYRHSSKDEAFVRTGLGGEKVVMGGGALVIPIVHDITRVNMGAVPIEVRRTGEQSLITKNKMRIDLVTEFSVRVIASRDGVSVAARTLGERSRDPGAVKQLVQSRLADALASVAPTMTMDEIHTNRAGFMEAASRLAARSLGSNGLELENAALVSLNQSDIAVFNPDNAFDAEGLTRLTEEIEARRQLRNRIENESRIAIKLRDYEAETRAIEIERDLEFARLDQARQIEQRRAAQLAQIEAEQAASAIAIASARVRAEEEGERIRIARDRAVEEARIESAEGLRATEIARRHETELADVAARRRVEVERIASRQEVEAGRIVNEHKIREAEILSRRELDVASTDATALVDRSRVQREREVEQSRIETGRVLRIAEVESDRAIRVVNEEADAAKEKAAILRRYDVDITRIEKDEEIVASEIAKNERIKLAEAAAFQATEQAATSASREIDALRVAARRYVERIEIEKRQEIEIVDKERLIAVINKSIEEALARTEEAAATARLAAAEEQVVSARNTEIATRAKTVELIEAQSKAEREAVRVVRAAGAEREAAVENALATIESANAMAIRTEREADGRRRLNEAENMRSEASRASAIYETLVTNLPAIIRETVKPMERIESIKILQVDGVPGLNSPSETAAVDGGGNITDRVVQSAMKYRTQVAFVDGLMKDLGLPLENLGSAGGMSFRNFDQSGRKDKDD